MVFADRPIGFARPPSQALPVEWVCRAVDVLNSSATAARAFYLKPVLHLGKLFQDL